MSDKTKTLVYKESMLEKLSHFHPDYMFNITSIKNFIKEEPEVEQVETLMGLPSAQRWIPCSERLPAEGEEVLLTNLFRKMDIGWLVKTEDEGYLWEITGSWYNAFNDWIAWMSLPEPYKAESEDKE